MTPDEARAQSAASYRASRESPRVVVERLGAGPIGRTGEGVGVDRLSLSFPVLAVRALDHEWSSHQLTNGRPSASTVLDLDGAKVMVGITSLPKEDGTTGVWAKVEGNPSRLSDPDGCSLLPFDSVQDAARVMWEVARAFVAPACPLEAARVKRLDVARDFTDVQVPAVYVRGLLNLKRAYARKSFMYSNPQAGNAETLFVGSKSGGVRLYDQHQAYAEKGAAEGSVRWEVEARADWLERLGMARLGDVQPHRLETMGWDRWDWSAMGTAVTGAGNVVELVQALAREGHIATPSGKPSWAKADRLLGQLVREGFGVSAPAAKGTTAEYNKLKKLLGIVPTADLLSVKDSTVMGRLDFATGREVAMPGPRGTAGAGPCAVS